MFIKTIIILPKFEVDIELVLKMAVTFSHLYNIMTSHVNTLVKYRGMCHN